MRWSDRQTHVFVKLYLGHKCLWDTTHKHYRIKFQRLDAYRDIITKFHALTKISIDEGTVIQKIRNLRSAYSKELIKIQTRESFTPFLSWFKDWHKCFQKHKSRLEGRSSDDQLKDENESDDDNESCDNLDLDREPSLEPSEEECNILYLKEDSEIVVEPIKCRKRKKRSSSSSDQSKVVILESDNTSDDEFDMFAKYLASQLRKIDVQRVLTLQMEIQSLLSAARMDSLSVKKTSRVKKSVHYY